VDLPEDPGALPLSMLGLAGLTDPVRPSVRPAVAECRAAGIRVVMISGDYPATALSIARQIGLADEGGALTGAELAAMDDEALRARVGAVSVFARIMPEQKVRVVEALKARGEIVAMTGDGVNDAAAMHAAHIGVAMGQAGTDVAKEAGQMVLTDDNFATIVNAVERGRAIYDNIVNFVRFQLSTNFGAIITILLAQVVGLPAPFTAIQILWVNLIMDGPPALALGVDPPDPDVMERPPRDPDSQVLDLSRVLHLLLVGAVMAAGTLGMQRYGLAIGDEALAGTMAFTTFVLYQVGNAFNARDDVVTAFRLPQPCQPPAAVGVGGRGRAPGRGRQRVVLPGDLRHHRTDARTVGARRRRRGQRADRGGGAQGDRTGHGWDRTHLGVARHGGPRFTCPRRSTSTAASSPGCGRARSLATRSGAGRPPASASTP
jgi:Ca2+-transporting ATPase